ncbi:membrane protein insertase, YidC/Oxa1 family [Eubacterium brachy ATCC 33089]|jgi:membrane protein insertase, yidC/oxa1 family|nr:membrane protein insertase, YidC/Oxa1 family [Eubacterium brachy ATCC 33089]
MNTIIGIFAKPLGYLLVALHNIIGNYGISLIILTTIVKVCLYPLYIKQMKSTIGASAISGKIKQIRQKYANDKETMNIKIQELYKQEGVNPAGGCLPALIQMPILFALFALLRDPLSYIKDNTILIASHESFLWMADLSHPDKWILPILAGIATYISFSISQQSTPQMSEMGGMMKATKYVFPMMIVLLGRSYPAGLSIYWFFGQFLQIFFNLHINKLRKKAELERSKGRKGNR